MTRVLYIGDPSSVHDIKWVSFFSTRPDFEVYFLVQEHEMNLLTPQRRAQFKELQIGIEGPIKSYSLWRFWENIASLKTINRIISQRKIDIVHPLFATPFALWTTNLSVPSIITTRGSDVHVVLANLKQGNLLRRIHGNILLKQFKEAFQKAGAISSTSRGQLKKVNDILGTNLKGEIIRTGVNVDGIDKLIPDVDFPGDFEGKRIIFLPRYIQPIYQTEIQLEALKSLPADLKKTLALVLIKGKKDHPEYIKKIELSLKEVGIVNHTYEMLTQHQMWSMFKRSALAIMTPRTDGTPNSALEAMAAKCPLLLGSFEYDEDLFGNEFCLRMKSTDPSELAALIKEALSDYPAKKLERAFENVEKNGNRPIEMSRLHEIYLRLAQG